MFELIFLFLPGSSYAVGLLNEKVYPRIASEEFQIQPLLTAAPAPAPRNQEAEKEWLSEKNQDCPAFAKLFCVPTRELNVYWVPTMCKAYDIFSSFCYELSNEAAMFYPRSF